MLDSHLPSRLAPSTGMSSGAWTMTRLGDNQVLSGYGLHFVRSLLSFASSAFIFTLSISGGHLLCVIRLTIPVSLHELALHVLSG